MFLPAFALSTFILTLPTVRGIKRDTATIFKKQYGNLRENCFPRPSGGCQCIVKERNGTETIKNYDSDEWCKLSAEVQTMHRKKQLSEEIKDRFGNYKENCFPMPTGGCKCTERGAVGDKMIKKYDDDTQCKVSQELEDFQKNKRTTGERPSQNVRDPIRERAQANYRAVINELNEKFRGLKEGCFPRPKGCLCVVGKDRDGRDITERRLKDRDCKCQPGERSQGCPVSGA
uniref:Uncharacterized protein n=1 Tax=Setaria digitata TaxID=48799 RepID=A0A915PHQ2_9BILA